MLEIMNEKMSFYDVLSECEKQIDFYLCKLHIKPPHDHYYEEGLYLLWAAYRIFDRDNEAFSHFANEYIETILVELKRQTISVRDQIQFRQSLLQNKTVEYIEQKSIQSVMAVNQWKWVYMHVFSEQAGKRY